ncbi:PTS sugar transporter subunit IIA [Propionispira raffinosivorans]|uniref:PTS sugar transporter subunit IIA n=1 Tax=Propionispira raffinosivorans TaxID=86959 RepID=UPI000374D3C2|nr:PTS sugar transporter subunit IIA [Propionispira raffinosivorans]
MMASLLHEELVLLNYQADNAETLLKELAIILHQQGYVKDSYIQAILAREKEFPTGLNTPGVKLAMPHAAPKHVYKEAILVAKLAQPVMFKEMGNSGKDVEASLIFMLAVQDPKNHLDALSKLMSIFSQKEKLLEVYNTVDKKRLIEKLNAVLN